MFRDTRYQTGELEYVVKDMKSGKIPCLEVDNIDEFNWCLGQFPKFGVYRVEEAPYDRNARDRVREPEFEFRVTFCAAPGKSGSEGKDSLMYIDFYFEPEVEKTYDSIGEI